MQVKDIPCRTILNPTGGFLGKGFTHTINLYRGCALGNTLCGMYCYAQWIPYHLQGREWSSFLDIKEGVNKAYRHQYDRMKNPKSGETRPLNIFMSSVTEPYPPQERASRRTRRLLKEMVDRPPDLLVIQTHTPLILDDLHILKKLNALCTLRIHITVETDQHKLPKPFPRHAYTPKARIRALQILQYKGLHTIATVSPLLPLNNPWQFATDLEESCERVILDHYLLGDGSQGGQRTKRTLLPQLLKEIGLGTWSTLEKFYEVVDIFKQVFGDDSRVGVSQEGFNTNQT